MVLTNFGSLTVWVYKGDEVEVVVVEERSDKVIFFITIDELIGKIFDSHCRNPFASVCGTVPKDRLILVFAILAPEVDALLRTTFERLTRDKCL